MGNERRGTLASCFDDERGDRYYEILIKTLATSDSLFIGPYYHSSGSTIN